MATLAVAAAAQEAPRLGGYLPFDDTLREVWCWSAAWCHPVGDALDYTRPTAGQDRGFALLRGMQREPARHDGADLGDGGAGAPVRAAAHGVIVRILDAGDGNGYGRHVVLAHRLAEGGIAFSVYAHLGPGGPPLAEGDRVSLGETIGVVGHSGRASTDHLHFEVRRPRELTERWENATPVDPLAFVAARLPMEHAGESAPVVLWGEAGDLLVRGDDPAAPLQRRVWWHMLWRSARHGGDVLPDGPRSLGEALTEAGVLPEHTTSRAGAVTWYELGRDLARLRAIGVRLPTVPAEPDTLRAWCERGLGTASPSRHPTRLGRRSRTGPTVGQALLALADLAGDASR
jgi:hypothetical protein